MTDPDTPTLPPPPHITIEQAYEFSRSLLRGDPNEAGILKQSVKGMADMILPGR